MKKILISLLALFSIAAQAQTFPVNNLTAAGYITAVGNITTSGGQFIGAGTGLTGTAAGLSIGGNAVNIAGGLAGQLHCQTAANTTGFIAAGTTGYFLQAQSSGCPSWVAGSTYTPGSVAITGGTITGTGITAMDGSFSIENTADNTKIAKFSLSGFPTSTTYTYTLPSASGTIASLNTTQVFTTAQTFNSSITVTGTSNLNGLTNNIGNSTIGGVQNIGNGATLSGNNQTINIGTAGASGSTTNINLGGTYGSTINANNQLVINPVTATSTMLQVGSGSASQAGLYIGNSSSGYGGIWSTGVTPSVSNYALVANSNATNLNATTALNIAISGFGIAAASSDTMTIKGTVLGGNAAAGQVGEVIKSTANGVSMSAGVVVNLTSITLTAGDWDVYGNSNCQIATTGCYVAISTTSATFPAIQYIAYYYSNSSTVGGAAPTVPLNITSTTTVYLVGLSTVSSASGGYGSIFARRAR